MLRRFLIAGVLGGVAMFAWSSIAHMVLPLGEAGLQEIPNESELLGAMRSKLGESSGFYLFPAMVREGDRSAAMTAYSQKLAVSPSGLLIYHPPGGQTLTPGRLVTEFLAEVAEALLLAWLVMQTRLGSYGSRLGFAAVCGVLAALVTNISYWNWYGFPGNYTASYMLTQVLGFVAAGLVIARLKPAQ
jgi:hypothetical protein